MSKKKNLLFLSSWPPLPVESGGQVVTSMLLSYYKEMGFSIDLMSLVPREEQAKYTSYLGTTSLLNSAHLVPYDHFYAQTRLKHYLLAIWSLVTKQPFYYLKQNVQDALRCIDRLLKNTKYDLIHCEYPNALLFVAQKRAKIPLVYVQHNIDFLYLKERARTYQNPFIQSFFNQQANLTKELEKQVIESSDLVLCMGNDDIQLLNPIVSNSHKLHAVKFRLEDRINDKPKKGYSIVSLGSLSALKRARGTMWFAREVFPLVKKVTPSVEWYIVGRFPSKEVKDLDDGKNVHVHGYVENIEYLMEKTKVCVVPLFEGSGRQMKIDEMASRGIPCVTTTTGFRNSDLTAGKEIFVGDEPETFAKYVIDLLTNDELYSTTKHHLSQVVGKSRLHPNGFTAIISGLCDREKIEVQTI
ncbi:MAG: glycosyltransferase family 4 protein [Ignavibacteriae bacterium]|nr:glycosyltransferase family 4 protein [Ignavibacteriota bacterium]